MTESLADLSRHIGAQDVSHDVVTASQIGRMAAALGVAHPARDDGDVVPPGWHGAFFPPLAPLDTLREDGQPSGGGIVPPVPLARRRLSAVRAQYHDPIRIGDALTNETQVADIKTEDFGYGPTVLVTMRESIRSARGPAATEERDLFFFGEGGPGKDEDAPTIPDRASWQRQYDSDPVMMFRLSAVRFNSHRVHYDRDYTTKVEGLPGLVVPLTLVSALLLELCRAEAPNRPVAGFTYRSIKRVYDLGPFTIFGAPDDDKAILWATDHEGALAVYAEAEFAV